MTLAHLGGLLMGLLVGMVLYPIISPTARHRTIVWALRLAAIPAAILLYVFLIRNFYTSDPYAGMSISISTASLPMLTRFSFTACSWCRYLSCIPSSSNNHCKGCVLSYFPLRDVEYFALLLGLVRLICST